MEWVEWFHWLAASIKKKLNFFFNCGVVGYRFWRQAQSIQPPSIPSLTYSSFTSLNIFFSLFMKQEGKEETNGKRRKFSWSELSSAAEGWSPAITNQFINQLIFFNPIKLTPLCGVWWKKKEEKEIKERRRQSLHKSNSFHSFDFFRMGHSAGRSWFILHQQLPSAPFIHLFHCRSFIDFINKLIPSINSLHSINSFTLFLFFNHISSFLFSIKQVDGREREWRLVCLFVFSFVAEHWRVPRP